jgi:hypothetical protein
MPQLSEFQKIVLGQLRILRQENQILANALGTSLHNEEEIMATQAEADALAQRLLAVVTEENTALANIQAAVANLVSANPQLDLTELTNAVAAAETAASQEADFSQNMPGQPTPPEQGGPTGG